MAQSKSRFFIALLPPQEIQDYVKEIQQYFGDRYASYGAQKSPPHITLQPPFEWLPEQVPVLEQCLSTFALNRESTFSWRQPPGAALTSSVPVTLNGFGAFPPRVIYVNVLKTQELLTLQTDLMTHLETLLGIVDPVSKTRAFSPHMTVAFRDLTRQNFKAAWPEFQQRQLHFEFTSGYLTLLLHNGKRWNVSAEFPFSSV